MDSMVLVRSHHLTPPPSSLLPLSPSPLYSLPFSSISFLPAALFLLLPFYTMKLISINPKTFRLNAKQLFRSKRERSAVSRSDPPSFSSSGTSSSSDESTHKPAPGAPGSRTPTSVLPDISPDWSDHSTEIQSDLAQALRLVDRDDDGIISREELEAFLTRLGESQEDVAMMLSDVDPEGSGCISVDALLSRVGPGCGSTPDSDSLREAFEVFDTDRDGKISAEELLEFFKAIGDERCTLEECRRMIKRVDRNGDGFVCFEEFSRMMEPQR
ncbi:probable calcium-binding protein CML35 [Prosopis cineraria]|uniref:probable calcium-binding protein CML35 n=1 Tax=Prosopis cineraria TaxID=364024 RepID=UPI00240F324C|nr:probable calcium-binding protein CML35 [Prosopis cineraria]